MSELPNEKTDIILFDGICNLCNGLVNFIIKRDPNGKYKFAALQSESGKNLLLKIGLPTTKLDTLIVVSGDTYYTKSTAALRISRELTGHYSLLYPLIKLPRPFRDGIYKIIVKMRYRIFGKRNSCMVPTQELTHRFI